MSTTRRLGQFNVHPIGLGAMPFSQGGQECPPEERAIATVHAALDAGVTLIDTADIYAPTWDAMGHNELIVAKALHQYSGDTSRVIVATKGGITRGEGESWGRNASPDYMRRALEKSLANLDRDSIDLYYLHRPDRSRLFAEMAETMGSLKQEGLIKEIGISNANVEELRVVVDVLGEGELAAVQNEFSLRFNDTSQDELDYCGRHGVAFLPWSPLGGTSGDAKVLHERYPSVMRAAENHGVSPQQVVLAWELAQGEHVIPIPGASRPESISDSAQAAALQLDEAEVDAINQEAL